MGRRLIEVMQLLVDQIHKAGYQHRALEDDIYAESQKRIAAEKDRDAARAEIETLRQQLAEAQRAASDEFERQVLTVEQQQDAAAWQQQVDSANAEISYLRARLDEERSVIASLRQQLAEAQQPDVGAMQAERERLANLVRFVEQVRAEAHEDPELYGPFVRLVRDLDAKVGAK